MKIILEAGLRRLVEIRGKFFTQINIRDNWHTWPDSYYSRHGVATCLRFVNPEITKEEIDDIIVQLEL